LFNEIQQSMYILLTHPIYSGRRWDWIFVHAPIVDSTKVQPEMGT